MAAIVSMQGRINVDNAGEMRQTLADALRSQAANSKLTVDLSGVTYMDTSGVATLMEAMRTARQQGSWLALRGVQDQTRWLLEVTHLDHVFEIEEGGSK